MHISVITAVTALAGLSAAAPNGWSDYSNFPGKPSSSSVAASSSTTSSYSFPGGPSSCTASTATVTVTSTSTAKSDCPTAKPQPSCYLDDAKAAAIIATYEKLTSRSITGAEFNATAGALLAANFSTLSNSLNAELGKPLEALSIPSKQAFIAAFWNKPPSAGTSTLDIFHSCSQIAWRWLGTSGGGLPVRGLTMMNVTDQGQVGATYIEYFRPALWNCSQSIPSGTK